MRVTKLKDNVVIDPESGQKVLANELVVLDSGQDVESLVKEYGGKITVKVEETETYQVKFPVSDLNDLNIIADKLRRKGVEVTHVIVMNPPTP